MADAVDTLDDAVDELYRVFAAYPLRPWTDACPCCHTEKDERAVRRRPLRELRPDDLAEFAADSLMTWGDVVDFKHFLPRLFEILAEDGFPDGYPDMETVVGALERGSWRTWPPDEQTAVEGFLTALWMSHLAGSPMAGRTDMVLASIATAVDDMTPYLDLWLELDGIAPAVRFAEFLEANSTNAALGRRLSNPWLSGRREQEAQVREWLLTSALCFLPRLEAAFDEAVDEDTSATLELAIALARNARPGELAR